MYTAIIYKQLLVLCNYSCTVYGKMVIIVQKAGSTNFLYINCKNHNYNQQQQQQKIILNSYVRASSLISFRK